MKLSLTKIEETMKKLILMIVSIIATIAVAVGIIMMSFSIAGCWTCSIKSNHFILVGAVSITLGIIARVVADRRYNEIGEKSNTLRKGR